MRNDWERSKVKSQRLNWWQVGVGVVFGLIVLGQLERIQITQTIAIYLHEVVMGLLLFKWFVSKRRIWSLEWSVIAVIGVTGLSLVVHIFQEGMTWFAGLYWLRFSVYISFLPLLVELRKKDLVESLYPLLLGVGGGWVLGGIGQYLLFPDTRELKWLGWDDHYYRAIGSILDPNFLGVLLVLTLILVLKFRQKLGIYSWVVGGITGLTFLLTYSRSAYLSLVAAGLVLALKEPWVRKLAGVGLVLFLTAIWFLPRPGGEGVRLERVFSIRQRWESQRRAVRVWLAQPVIGVGFNNFRFAREKFGYKDTVPFGFSHSGGGSDSSFALVLATTGIPGFLAYIFLLYKMIRLGMLNIKKSPYALILVVSLSGLIVNSLLLNSLLYSFIMIWMWILAGLTQSNSRG